MPPREDQNRIEELKKSLYSRDASPIRTRRKLQFSDVNTDVNTKWEEPTETEQAPKELNNVYKDKSMSILTKFLIGSIIFCILAVSAGVYLFLNGANLISGNNIGVVISGPVSIPGGSPVSFNVNISNNNNIDLQQVDMNIAFPAGATDPSNPSNALISKDKFLGDIAVGESTSTDVSAIIFGEENTQKSITVTLTYKIKGSSALFTKVASYDVLINSSPITLSVSSFTSITSGQEFDMTIHLKSNSNDVLKNVLVQAQYPFGFTFISSNLPPLSDNATWKIGDIPSGSEQSIVIHGKLQGENTDTRVFHFIVGARSSTNSAIIGTQYGLITQNISIEKPFVSLGIGIDNDNSSSDFVGHFGSQNRVTITWFNNLSVNVSNAVITMDLSGTAYNKNKINPDLGYFDSAKNEIVWNQQTNPELASIPAGGSGSVSFMVTPIAPSASSSGSFNGQVVNPNIVMSSNIKADRTQESGVSGNLTAATSRNINVASNISLSGKIVSSIGPFTNSGPIPPKAEQKTTYTVVWTISNTTSSVSNVEVTATLPAYVTWVGQTSPSNEKISFDPNSGTVTWDAGSINANTSDVSKRREVYFQIAFTPSITQVNTDPILVNESNLTATDDFTGANLTSRQDYMTTSISTDPSYKGGDETVVQ